jgi:hypothetical protein
MKAFKAVTHAAPVLPSIYTAGSAAMQGDYKGAALSLGSSVLPMAGGRAGQRLMNNAVESGSKAQALAGKVLSRSSGAAPNAVGAMQTYQTYQAYQRGEVSGAEVAKSVLYTGMPFAAGRMNRRTHTPDAPQAKGTKPDEPMTRPLSDREAGAIAGTGPSRTNTRHPESNGHPSQSPTQHPANEPHRQSRGGGHDTARPKHQSSDTPQPAKSPEAIAHLPLQRQSHG